MKLACLLLMVVGAWGQGPTFEVASVKPSQSLHGFTIRNARGGRFETVNTTVAQLIQYAVPAQSFQVVGGPSWIRYARFDITAIAGQSDSDVKNQAERIARIRARLRHLLEDRFQLELHVEEREMRVYELEAETGRVRMKAAPPLGNVNMNRDAAGSTLKGDGMTMPRLAEVLSGIVGRPVTDETGFDGAYDLDLKYSLEMATEDPGAATEVPAPAYPSLFTALKEQLGLRLTSKKGMAKVWVVVRAEKPGEN